MSIKIKNPKSDKELAAHGYRDGKIVFNAGSQTGPKASDYLFNDINVPIFGSNFQVKVKPQQTKEFNVNDNSVVGYSIKQSAKELGAVIDGSIPPVPPVPPLDPVDVHIVITTVAPEEFTVTVDKTYAEMQGGIKSVTAENVYQGQSQELDVYTRDTLPDGEFMFCSFNVCYPNTSTPLNPDSVYFYLPSTSSPHTYVVVDVTPNNDVHVIAPQSATELNKNNYYYVTYDGINGFKLNYFDDTACYSNHPDEQYIGFDRSAIKHIESELVRNHYIKQSIVDMPERNYHDNTDVKSRIGILGNILALPMGGYCLMGNGEFATNRMLGHDRENYYTIELGVQYSFFNGASEINYGCFSAMYNNDETELKYVSLQFGFEMGENERFTDYVDFTSDLADIGDYSEQQNYDVEFDLDITFEDDAEPVVVVTSAPTVPVFDDGIIGKLASVTVHSPEAVITYLDSYVPRSYKSMVYHGQEGPDGAVLYYFDVMCGVGITDGGQYNYKYYTICVYYAPGATDWTGIIIPSSLTS